MNSQTTYLTSVRAAGQWLAVRRAGFGSDRLDDLVGEPLDGAAGEDGGQHDVGHAGVDHLPEEGPGGGRFAGFTAADDGLHRAVETARSRLTGLGYEVLVFHATGAGGRALEALAEARLLAGVLDVTTTELADDLVGGVLSAGPDRLTAAGAAGLPQADTFVDCY